MGNPFKRGADAAPGWSDQNQQQVIDPLTGKISDYFGHYDPSKAQSAYDPLFSGQQAKSLEQGAQGYLGKAGGMFGAGKTALQGDASGANDWLSSILNPNFTDINNNPQVQGVLAGLTNAAQRGFNIGADKIAGSAAGTSGGLGKGTATTDSLSRLGADTSNQLAGTTANFLQGELARRQGLQQNASQQALGDRLGMASAYGNLGQGLGQLGISQGGLGLNLAQYINQQQQAGANYPLDNMMRLAALLKSNQSVAQPSIWDDINSIAKTGAQVGSAVATGGTSMAGVG